jgi:hypothetical protein
MSHTTNTNSRGRSYRVVTVALILASVATFVAVTGEPAEAASCSTATPAGTTCTMTGTMTLGAGTLTLTGPSSGSLTWGTTLSGLDQTATDTTSTDQIYTVNDATGSYLGWHVTVSATQFTTGSLTLSNTGTLSTNGSVTSVTGTTAPSTACTASATCTLPTNTTTYPVAITTAATSPTAYTVYDDSANTGIGSVDIGGSASANPVGWWVSIPATTKPGTYTSTVTMEVISAP